MLIKLSYFAVVAVLAISTAGCATLEGLRALVQMPRFEQDDQRRSEVLLTGGGDRMPTGATVRIWTRVTNPNSFGLTLGTLRGALHLEGSHAATVDFPLGLPLPAGGEEVVPIDIAVNFRDLHGLGSVIARAISREPIDYELEGTIGVSANAFGEAMFGPMTILRGELR